MPERYKWIVFAVLGALFASLVQLLSKPALERMETSAVNMVRAVVVVVVFAVALSWERGWGEMSKGGVMSAGLWLAAASGVAAGLSWFFGYQALKLASVSQSYPLDKLSVVFAVVLAFVLLGDRPSLWNWLGILAILIGAYLVTLQRG